MNGSTDSVTFHINGKKFVVQPGSTENSHPNSLLVDYIRREAALTGTKFMCREGGCGACVVTVRVRDPFTGQPHTSSINACLTPVLSCDGWDITTVERLGNHRDGYNLIQKRLVDFSGTQCGYCTPGMVMNMYGLLKSNPGGLTSKEIEDSFDGNVCRCTGFRPILDAMKSFAPDASEEIKRKCVEFERQNGGICELKNACCKAGKCLKEQNGPCGPAEIEDICRNTAVKAKSMASGQIWIRPTTLREALETLQGFVAQKVNYRVVAGNTSTGIFKNDGPFKAYLDVNGIPELRSYTVGVGPSGLVIGGAVKLTRAVEILKQVLAKGPEGYEYADGLEKHWLRVANVPVRNAGTIAGNLMIKHAHEDFPSDIYLTLEALGATVELASTSTLTEGSHKIISIAEFLRTKMAGQLIVSIRLPSLPKREGWVFRSYKITKRYQNAHAYVNGAMLFQVDPKLNVIGRPRICFGGIYPSFVHANATEGYLAQKSLTDPSVVQAALKTLEQELEPDARPPEASPLYRKNLARNLLYKTILGVLGGKSGAAALPYVSGGGDIEYRVTSGKQTYETHKEQWPLTQPVPKLEAPIQTSGEAQYINDIHAQPGELFGAFVIARVANASLKSVDAAEAMAMPGVVGFVTAKDIRGPNNYIHVFGMEHQEIFAESKITAAGQPIGLLLAESRVVAFEAVKKVKVTHDKVSKPVLTIQEGIKVHEKEGSLAKVTMPAAKIPGKPGGAGVAPKHKIKGEFEIGPQYHFHMETQTVLCVPKEGGLMDVFSATQFVEQVQASVASAIGVPNHNVKVEVRRLGGGFGAKGSAATLVATAAAIGAAVTNRPVRVVLDLETNMEMIGKRTPYLIKYETGFDDSGKIGALTASIYADMGVASVEPDLPEAMILLQNCYQAYNWEVNGVNVYTNKARSLFCRAPGTTQGMAMIETIMEHVAHFLKKDPLEVRLVNLIRDGDPLLGVPGILPSHGPFEGENLIPSLIDQMRATADFERRKAEVAAFNKANRWVKKGLSVVPMRYPQHMYFWNYPCYVAIYHVDGSVIVSHGGVEMGQGINTKVAQTVAHALGVGLEQVKVAPTDSVISANAIVTGGAVTSELVCWAGIQACKILKERMAPIATKSGAGASWEKVVAGCYDAGIDLKASYLPSAADNLKGYNIWALNVTEVEVDILTGQFKIARVDMIEDAGKSMSPEVDIGQVEGSLVMGIGLWTLEKLSFDEKSGELLVNNTWEYKPPFAKDIPEDLRVTLLANAPNPIGVHGSKATGEPPLCSSVAVVFALKQAIDSARQDAGNFDHYQLNTPVTPESVVLLSLAQREHLKL